MFRIPDYVADTRLDSAAPPDLRADGSVGRAVTRLGAAFGGAGDRLSSRQRAAQAAAFRKEAARQAEAARQQRPPGPQPAPGPQGASGAAGQKLRAHLRKRHAQASAFAAERRYLQLQAEADRAEAAARAEAGPSGAGFAAIYERALDPIGQKLGAGLPADIPADHRAALAARFDADRERRLARAAGEEVQSGRAQTRAELARMQAALLARLAREPERYDEIVAQGAAFTAGNILPDEETAVLVADWYEQAERALAAARAEGGVTGPAPAAGEMVDRGGRDRAQAPTTDNGILGEFGRITEAEARAEVAATEVAAVKNSADALARAARLKPLQAIDLGFNPEIEDVVAERRREEEHLPLHLRQSRLGGFARAAREAMHARDQLSGKAQLPRFSKLRNAIDRFVTGLGSLGPDAMKAAGIVGSLAPSIADDNALMYAADRAEKHIRSAFPGDPARAEEFLSRLAEGSGSMAGFLVGNVVIRGAARLVGASARTVQTAGTIGTSGLGAAVQGVAGFEDAQRLGADQVARYTAFFLNAGLGVSEAVPIDRFFGRINRLSDDKVGNILRTTTAQSLEEFTQEVVQSLGRDAIAKAVYDPDRDIDLREVLEDGLVGAIIGSAMGASAGATDGTPSAPQSGNRTIPDQSRTVASRHGLVTRLNAQRELAIFKKNADKVFKSATAPEYFGPVWDRLPPHMQDFLNSRYTNFVGQAGHNIISRRLDEAGFNREPEMKRFELPEGFARSARIYDEVTSQKLKLSLFDLFARPVESDRLVGVEAKVASSKDREQELADKHLIEVKKDIAGVETLRMPANRIKAEDLAEVIDGWLKRRNGQNSPGGVPEQDVMDLIRELRKQTDANGKPLTIGQVSLVVLGATLPLLYPAEPGDAEIGR